MPGVKVFGDPRPKGSLICRGPRTCRKCRTPIVHPVTEDDAGHKAAEWRKRVETAGLQLRQALGGTITAPVAVDATFVVARPKAAAGRAFPHLRSAGDVDKLARMLLDALTSCHVIADDSLVVELVARKQYPGAALDRPGVLVIVEPLAASDTPLPI